MYDDIEYMVQKNSDKENCPLLIEGAKECIKYSNQRYKVWN